MKQETEDRKCILTGEVKSKDELLRFTLISGGRVIPDFKKKLPGRGIYVSNSKQKLETAILKNQFAKATKGRARADLSLVDMTEALLKKKGLEAINLARKAGELVTGFDKVKDALGRGKVAFVLEACDAGADGHEKVLSMAKGLDVFGLYTTEELDKALDKVNTVHAAFLKSEMSKTVYKELKRYECFLHA